MWRWKLARHCAVQQHQQTFGALPRVPLKQQAGERFSSAHVRQARCWAHERTPADGPIQSARRPGNHQLHGRLRPMHFFLQRRFEGTGGVLLDVSHAEPHPYRGRLLQPWSHVH